MKNRLFKGFLVAVIAILIMTGIVFGALKALENQRIKILMEKNGNAAYKLELSDDGYVVAEKENAKYFFKIKPFSIDFTKCEIIPEDTSEVKEGRVVVYIYNCYRGKKVNVAYHDNRIVITDKGEEERYSVGNFDINTVFDESSMEPTAKIDGETKLKKSYNHITKFITLEELKEYYNTAISIRDQLNE